MAWTDEDKQKAIDLYLAAEPTAANSMEIVKQVADEMGQSPNGVRMILTKADKYVKKEAPAGKAASGGSSASGDKPARVSKEGAQAALSTAISDAGGEVDSEIISKLTGKAAQYFTAVIAKITSNED